MLPKDPNILLSYINLKLRDFYDSLDSLCDDLDVSKDEIIDALKSIGYSYDDKTNQFK
jgi:hypothetical protein